MKSYAGDRDDKQNNQAKDSSALANDAAKKAEAQMESIKEEARSEVKRQQKP
ncbi:hypothetical protein [Sporosarcina highlanderae]|uniref:Uncharacterized protein n=1 Tax=Sporosarcina highlanderae TaxID=3035916 RepID=A0ABT8JNH8_9BACL|nr:hypothetical protein [Sporosarcina highlanderae]MDN4606597.1 hypothetical protein [Sporosarcina highlanderae]